MESEKVKETKELLRCMNGEKACTNCYINEVAQEQETFCINVVADMTLDLINELESENESLKKDNELLRNAKVVYENVDYYYEDLKKAEKRIADLEKENGELLKENEGYHGSYRCAIDKIGELSAERYIKVEQFAERLKEKFYYEGRICRYIIDSDVFDETLKEFIDGKERK